MMARFHREKSPSEEISHNQAPVQKATFSDSGSKVTAYIALIMTGITLGMFMMYALLTPQILDAKIAAGAADARAEANAAKVNARVALDKVESMRVQLAAKNMVIEDH